MQLFWTINATGTSSYRSEEKDVNKKWLYNEYIASKASVWGKGYFAGDAKCIETMFLEM